MSPDMRLLTLSDETSNLDGSESMDVGLSVALGLKGATDTAKTAAYISPPSSGGTRCRPQDAACSPVTDDVFAGRGADPASGAGRLMAGSDESPELANSLALRLPASRLGRRWGLWSHLQMWFCGSLQS